MAGTVWSVDTFTGYEGIPLPPKDDLGCYAIVQNVDGWQTLSDPRVTTTDRPYADGTLDGPSTQPGRAVTITGTTKAPDQIALLRWMDRFTALLTTGDRNGSLTAVEPHLMRHCSVRRGGEAIADPTLSNECTFSMILYAADPIRYGTQITASTVLPFTSPTAGFRAPFRAPFRVPAIVNSGRITLTNVGTAPSPVKLRIDGPCTGPIITHQSSGLEIVFATDYVLSSGAWLDIDMDRHEVLENGQASRNGAITSRGWFTFDPGTNVIGFNAAVYNAASQLTAYVAPAWF